MAEEQQQATQQRGVELDQNQFLCPICLDLLEEPVSINCGHSYCSKCIEGFWDQTGVGAGYSCPQCRGTFNPRPVLRRNNLLSEVVEKLKKTGGQQTSPFAALACAGPADVACDFCCGTKPKKASMSSLTCLASYCPAHLEPHSSVPVLKRHQLVSATITLKKKMCMKHDKLKDIYCQTDKRCICYLCSIVKHKSHHMISAAAERATEQIQLTASQKKVKARVQEREKELKELNKAMEDFTSQAKAAMKDCDKIFARLTSAIQLKCSAMKLLITNQEKNVLPQAERLRLQLEEELTKLRKRDTELEQLLHTDDHIHFIQSFRSLSTPCESPDLPPGAVVRSQHSFETAIENLSELMRDEIGRFLNKTWPKISATVSTIDIVLPPVPKTREEFSHYCCPLTLDVNSVSNYFNLSEEKRRVTYTAYKSHYSLHSDRFKRLSQVLCREGLSKRCYWEVSLSGSTWSVAASYKDISRTSSDDSEFGKNDKSWSLECSPNGYSFQHNTRSMPVSGPQSSKIGVYLDYKAGTLSFYSISDTMTLLHKVHTTFTQPLYPGVGLRGGGSYSSSTCYAELIKLW